MKLEKSLKFHIADMRCLFRTINSSDVTKAYVNGLKEQTKYIENIPDNINISNQKKYVNNIIMSKDDTICGLFLDKVLVGTAGVQLSLPESFLINIDFKVSKIATVGIFIFNKNYRGMGLGKTLVWASTYLFYECTRIEWFGAGMKKDNAPSYKSFLSCGYKDVLGKEKECDHTIVNISELNKPELINSVVLTEYE